MCAKRSARASFKPQLDDMRVFFKENSDAVDFAYFRFNSDDNDLNNNGDLYDEYASVGESLIDISGAATDVPLSGAATDAPLSSTATDASISGIAVGSSRKRRCAAIFLYVHLHVAPLFFFSYTFISNV